MRVLAEVVTQVVVPRLNVHPSFAGGAAEAETATTAPLRTERLIIDPAATRRSYILRGLQPGPLCASSGFR